MRSSVKGVRKDVRLLDSLKIHEIVWVLPRRSVFTAFVQCIDESELVELVEQVQYNLLIRVFVCEFNSVGDPFANFLFIYFCVCNEFAVRWTSRLIPFYRRVCFLEKYIRFNAS